MTDLAARQLQAAEPLVQLGLDRAAEHLADWLADLHPEDYIDGVQDALTTLVQAGAADPR